MKTIEVVAAVILKDTQVLTTQRGYGDLQGRWEFPGGKIEFGEDHKAALSREIQEELDVQITVGDFLTTVEYDYPNFHLIMHAYQCELLGEFHLQEHSAARWLNLETLYDVDWLEADLPIVECVKSLIA